MRIVKKITQKLRWSFIKPWMYYNSNIYMKLYSKYLSGIGVKLNGNPKWISNDVYFDGSDYSLISLGAGCTISKNVFFLTHDFCMHTVIEGMENNIPTPNYSALQAENLKNKLQILGSISVGNNTFIGAKVMLLPGTTIGNNCIIGAGAVVKGCIPDNSIVIGNPAKIIGNVDEWLITKSKKYLMEE